MRKMEEFKEERERKREARKVYIQNKIKNKAGKIG